MMWIFTSRSIGQETRQTESKLAIQPPQSTFDPRTLRFGNVGHYRVYIQRPHEEHALYCAKGARWSLLSARRSNKACKVHLIILVDVASKGSTDIISKLSGGSFEKPEFAAALKRLVFRLQVLATS